MKHLVLATTHYPPANTAGARRPFNLARTFRNAGWQVSVVTTGEPSRAWSEGSLGESIWRVPVPELFSRATRRGAPGQTDASHSGPAIWRALRARVQRQVVAARCFPDLWRGVEDPMAAAMRASIMEDADTVLLSTAPPITVHQAAAAVHRAMPHIPWLAEYRDPWIEPGSHAVRWSGTYKAAAGRRLLRELLDQPDRVVAVSQGISAWLQARGAVNVGVAANGIPDALLDETHEGLDSGVLRYVGEFYLGRDPAPLLAAIGRLARRGVLPKDFRLELIGDVARSPGGPTADLLASHGIADRVSMTGRVPHADALRAVQRAGALVLLASGQPTQVPNKLYEYLGSGRPILAVVDRDGESHRLLRSAGMGDLVLTPESGEAEWDLALTRVIAESSVPTTPPTHLEALRTSTQLARVVEWCEALIDR